MQRISRRNVLGQAMAGAALVDPAAAAAQAVRVKAGDLPDLTIKEVKVYVVDPGQPGTAVTNAGYARIAAVVTNGGIEGNYTLARRYWHPNWSNEGWLEFAKRALVGKSVLDLPALTSQYDPPKRRLGQSSYASAIDACLWDILGKAVGLPIYRILGAYRTRVLAYASSQHHKTVEEFEREVVQCKADGFQAYKIHPPSMPDGGSNLKLDMDVCRAVRRAAGDDFTLLMDPVGVYSRDQAMVVGRLLEKLNFVAFEDPIPTTDIEGLAQLCQTLEIPVHVGEFIFSPYNYAEYIRRGAMDVVRFITDNVGGITGGMKIARMAELFGMECAPHNWGETFDHAVHFHCELAMPNNVWFEMTVPQGVGDRPYLKDRIRIAKDGYVDAPLKPGLGYEIDRAVLERMTKSVKR